MSKAKEKKNDEIQHHKKRAFLAAYSEVGNVTQAAEIVDIDRTSHYRWLKEDSEYAEAFQDADLAAGDNLEAEARRRAVGGVEEPVFHQGQVVGTVRKYSDSLLIFLMKGAKPEKYKDRVQSDTTLKGDLKHNVQVQHDLKKLTVEELEKLESILIKTTPESE